MACCGKISGLNILNQLTINNFFQTVALGWVRKQKESGFIKEYQSGSVQDEILRSHLKKVYSSFRFRNSSILEILSREGKSTLLDVLNKFFTDVIICGYIVLHIILALNFLQVIYKTDFTSGDISTVWRGVSFLPLDKQTCLSVHSVLAHLMNSFPDIQHTAFLFRDSFAW